MDDGVILLGSPLGSHDIMRKTIDTLIGKVHNILDSLHLLEDSHA